MKVNIIAGFLGAGKTTLLRRALEGGLAGERTAVLVNEFGPIGLDGELLRGGAVEMVQLASGCICCTLRGALAEAVGQIASEVRPDRLLIECTGIANPTDVLRTAAGALGDAGAAYHLCPTLTLVDAARFLELLPRLGHLLEPQVRGADVLVLNKLDGCPEPIQQETRRRLRALNAVAPLMGTTYARVDLHAMDGWSAGGGGSGAAAGGDAAPHGVAAWAFTEPGVFAEEALQTLLASLPESLLRLKGFVALPGGAHFLNAAPGDWQLEPLAGHRPTALVCIGPPGAQERLTAALRRCIINPS